MAATKTRQIRKAFDADQLKYICGLQDFTEYADYHELPGKDRFYYYKDNDSDILAVAHLDSVQKAYWCAVDADGPIPVVFSPVLDDRLGAYVILELLPKLGLNVDWLLTTDEEECRSTAKEFKTDKQYNWMFSFDRAGDDVVMYSFETDEYVELVEATGPKVGWGSVSDISYLEHLGCAAFNFGVGYQDYHSPEAYAFLKDTFKMVRSFLTFHENNKDTFLPHTEVKTHIYDEGEWGGWNKLTDDEKDKVLDELSEIDRGDNPRSTTNYYWCGECGAELEIGVCKECGLDWYSNWPEAEAVEV